MGKGTFISNDLWTNLALNGNILVTSLLQITAFSLSIFSFLYINIKITLGHTQEWIFFKELGAWQEKKNFLTKSLHFDLFLSYDIAKGKKESIYSPK